MVWYTTGVKLRDIRTAAVRGKTVLIRTDYNIETDGRGRPRDTTRLRATLPTLRWLLGHGAAIIIVSHRGRPRGRQSSLSLRPLVAPLSRLLGRRVIFLSGPLFSRVLSDALAKVKPGQVVLLENIRFEPGEEENGTRVARRLASFAPIVVNDAFADSHRAHASIVGLARFRSVYAGLLLQDEIKHLSILLRHPTRPFVAILGGAKISTKLSLIRMLLRRADRVLLGGALANTILQAEGLAIGASLTEPSMRAAAKGLSATNRKLEIPCDVLVSTSKRGRGQPTVRAVGNIKPKEIILDIGPDTMDLYRRVILQSRTVVWNGPMGRYETRPFDRGTRAMAKAIAESRATSVAGGGETLDAIQQTGTAKAFTFLSTGGGAMVEFLEGKKLPGLAVVTLRK